MKKKVCYWPLLIGLFLLSCGGSTNNFTEIPDNDFHPNRPETNVQVYYGNDDSLFTGDGIVNATITSWNESKNRTVQVGTISNGKLSFSFPTSLSNDMLGLFSWSDRDHPNLFVVPENANWCFVSNSLKGSFVVFNMIGERLGYLSYGKIVTASSGYVGDDVSYFFFNKDTTVTGSYILPHSRGNHIDNYQINAKRGWNRIHLHETWDVGNINIVTTFSTDFRNVPNDLKWKIY